MSWGILDFLWNDDIETRTVTSLEYSVPLAGASLVLYYRNVSFSVTQPLYKSRSSPRIKFESFKNVRVKQSTYLTFVLVKLSDTLLLLAQEFKDIWGFFCDAVFITNHPFHHIRL